MKEFEVTVAAVGVMRIKAESEAEARVLADRSVCTESIEWSTDWAVTDIEERV